ncbi:O-acyltransferase WSD1-like protein [Tanacetum coccineum]
MSRELYDDEPLTPAGRLFLQRETNIAILCCLGGHEPLRIDNIKSVVAGSMLTKHPRFSSILVIDKNGQEYWRKTEIDLDRHIFIHHDPIEEAKDDEDAVNIFMADLAVSVPFGTDKPLWEVHLLTSHKCAVIRVHHAVGDGISLLSLLLTMCRKADDPKKLPAVNQVVWFTMVFMFDFIGRALCVRDETTVVSGGAGVELWPRKLVTARFLIDDMKTVKKST